MRTRRLGQNGPEVSALGLGCMGMSDVYGPADRAESIATIHAALDAGITLLDTGDFYGMGDNEMLLAEALAGRRDRVVLSVKFGAQKSPDGHHIGFDGRPNTVKAALAYSLRRLKTDYVDIYRPARLDPDVPIEETVGAIAEMVAAGHVRHIGLSEVGSDTIRRAAAVHPIADLQIEYSLAVRMAERDILPTLRGLGIGLTAYGVLARGLIGGKWTPDRGGAAGDFRNMSPRFAGDDLAHNLQAVERLRAVADGMGFSVAQLALAWVVTRGEDVVPLIGARTRAQLADAVSAMDMKLSAADLAAIEAAMPEGAIRGDRYNAPGMAGLDSEAPIGRS